MSIRQKAVRAFVYTSLAGVFLTAGVAKATVYASDSFSYGTGSSIAGQNGGSGFSPGSSWAGSGTIVNNLSFAGVTSSGDALQIINPTDASSDSRATRAAAAVPYNSPVWESFLVRQDTAPVSTDFNNTGSRIGTQITDADGSNARYSVAPLQAGGYGTYDNRVGFGNSVQGQNPAYTLSAGSVYLVIARVTNAGLDTFQSGSIDSWVFDPSAFAAFIAAGGTEAELDSTAVDSADQTVTQYGPNAGITATDLFNISSFRGTATFDEVRIASSLADAISVPEPATIGLFGIAAILLARRSRSRA